MLKSRKNFIYLFTLESNASSIVNTYFKINIKKSYVYLDINWDFFFYILYTICNIDYIVLNFQKYIKISMVEILYELVLKYTSEILHFFLKEKFIYFSITTIEE